MTAKSSKRPSARRRRKKRPAQQLGVEVGDGAVRLTLARASSSVVLTAAQAARLGAAIMEASAAAERRLADLRARALHADDDD